MLSFDRPGPIDSSFTPTHDEVPMCRRITCASCGKPTWAGCGAHIEQVLGDVPKAERCSCRDEAAAGTGGAPSAGPSGSILGRLFGR